MLEKILRYWRYSKVVPWINTNSILIDIGSGKGEFFNFIKEKRNLCVGFEIGNSEPIFRDTYRIYNKDYCVCLDEFCEKYIYGSVETITILATIEHIEKYRIPKFAKCIKEDLISGGKLLITVPSPFVDKILKVFGFLIKDRTWKQHTGITVEEIDYYFSDFKLVYKEKFQFGLNNLLVYEKT